MNNIPHSYSGLNLIAGINFSKDCIRNLRKLHIEFILDLRLFGGLKKLLTVFDIFDEVIREESGLQQSSIFVSCFKGIQF